MTELIAALEALLASDGHSIKCEVRGCTCGSIEDYKAARSEAWRVLRKAREQTSPGLG